MKMNSNTVNIAISPKQLSAFLVVALFSVLIHLARAQSHPASNKSDSPPAQTPLPTGPNLEVTAKFIQDQLNDIGTIRWVDVYKDCESCGGRTPRKLWFTPVMIKGCTLTFTKKIEVQNEEDFSMSTYEQRIRFSSMRNIEALTMVEYRNRKSPDNPLSATQPSSMAALTWTAPSSREGNDYYDEYFPFSDLTTAKRVAKAIDHAAELCGRKTEPF